MSKHIIELNEDCKIVQQMCVTEYGNAYTDGCYSCDLEELNSDYINEHYGELQDEAYRKGFEDGKKSVEDEGLRNNINLIVTQCGYSLDEINDMIQKMRGERT